EIKTALAQWLSVGSHSNVPEGAIRYSKSQKRWEVYTGGAWGALEAEYNVNVKQLQGTEPNTAVSNNTLVKRTAQGQIKAAAPSTNDEVATRAFADRRYLGKSDTAADAAEVGGQDPSYYLDPASNSGGPLAMQYGGTGASSASGARSN